MTGTGRAHRNTIFVEEAEVIAQQGCAGDQYLLALQAPRIAGHATPGSFVHISCDPQLPMRRPISIMRVEPRTGRVELLYKVLGKGTALLAQRRVGERVSVMGPIGRGFIPSSQRPRPLLIGGGVGLPPIVFLADALCTGKIYAPFAILGSEVPFPFTPRPSKFMVPGMPDGVIAAMPLLEDWGIPSRLASRQGYAGCFNGYVTELARAWLEALDPGQRREVEVFACGPHPMLEAVARLAAGYGLPCQVSLEEFMACAVGGCAGCVVPVQGAEGISMKRVCVDGPVFAAASVFPEAG